jgi:hypothetical protein
MTFRLLTESHGEAVLTLFLEAFPVRTYLAPEKAQESTERDLPCGDIWRESSVKFDLERYLWKTALCLWEEDLPESSVTLPKWGMMRSGVCWERSIPVRLTRGIESGLWLGTPTASMTERSEEFAKGRLPTPKEVAEKWATPTTMDSLPPKSEKALLREATEVRPGRSKPGNLRDQVSNMDNWPTPFARDYKGGRKPETLEKSGRLATNSLPDAIIAKEGHGGQLNPTWVEWLMGWPLGWTDLKPLETDKFHQWSSSHGIPSTTFKTKP